MMLERTLTFILAGGMGSRLYPLTAERSKPSVPFGGKYRIIDFALSNCLHSGLHRVLVLTQYQSHSLHKHLRDGWSIFNPEVGEFITAVPPQMRLGQHWYQGTADAIYQNLDILDRRNSEYILILSGDHIYRMDYATMLKAHKQQGADVTIACMEININEASDFGIISTDHEHQVIDFIEKPQHPTPIPNTPDRALASMGIYVFSEVVLRKALQEEQSNHETSHDFGKDILPKLIHSHYVHAHIFGTGEGRVLPDLYWRDVGTIDSYYQANMDLLEPLPRLNLYQSDWPIRTYQPQTPPARTVPGKSGNEGIFINSMLAGGAIISGGNVGYSILFDNTFVDNNAIVEQSILFSGVRVGERTQLQNCIVDKNVEIPADERIGFDPDKDRQRFTISEQGIVVIPSGYRFD